MGMLLTINECCEEIRRLVQEGGYSINEAIDKVRNSYPVEKEKWKSINGFKGLYEISNFGKVKSLERKDTEGRFIREKILKNGIQNGYLNVSLNKEGQGYTFTIHRLVAEAFILNPDNLPQVNHIDENRLNNNCRNLEWCTRNYNLNYGARNDRISKAKGRKVYQYDLQGNFIKEWDSASECSRNGFLQSEIWSCCNGKKKTHKKYKWSYEKGYSQADKNIGDNHEKLINKIIAPGENIDNGQIYSEATGETLRNLI